MDIKYYIFIKMEIQIIRKQLKLNIERISINSNKETMYLRQIQNMKNSLLFMMSSYNISTFS